jgi:hypothetical protein
MLAEFKSIACLANAAPMRSPAGLLNHREMPKQILASLWLALRAGVLRRTVSSWCRRKRRKVRAT